MSDELYQALVWACVAVVCFTIAIVVAVVGSMA